MTSLSERWRATRQGFKPRDVEEPIDFHWHRPLAGLLVQLLVPTRVTPNQVTVISGLFSLLTGLALAAAAFVHPLWAVLAGFLLLASIVFDCADGQLARLRGTSSELGRILDGAMDAVAPLCVFFGQAAVLLQAGYPHPWVWPLGVVAAASLIWHASAYDLAKNLYLHCSRPDFSLGGATLMTVGDMERMRDEREAAGERLGSLLMRVWAVWTSPQMRAMEPWLDRARWPQNDAERALYVEHFRPQMRQMAWLGFGTHLFLLTLACWAAAWQPGVIWGAWLMMLGPMNVVAAHVALGRSRRERDFVTALAELRTSTAAEAL